MDKTIKLSEVIKICKKIQEGNLSQEEVGKLLEPIFIKSYLPIMEKYKVISLILYGENEDNKDDVQSQMLYIENQKFWSILMAYTNIDNSEEHLQIIQNYDLIMSTIGHIIISMCQYDYEKSCQMLDNAIQLSNIHNLISMAENLDISLLDKHNEEFKNAIDYLKNNKDTVDKISDIIKFNNGI